MVLFQLCKKFQVDDVTGSVTMATRKNTKNVPALGRCHEMWPEYIFLKF